MSKRVTMGKDQDNMNEIGIKNQVVNDVMTRYLDSDFN